MPNANATRFQAPLSWPPGWARTAAQSRAKSLYAVSFTKAWTELERELRLLGAQCVVLSANLALRNDGLPRAGAADAKTENPGVALYFVLKGKPVALACDCWQSLRDNVRAIGITVGAMRSIERAGAHELLDRAFEGFKALGPATKEPMVAQSQRWWSTLGVSSGASFEEVRGAYRSRARAVHPDAGGSDSAMADLNLAYAEAVAWHELTHPAG